MPTPVNAIVCVGVTALSVTTAVPVLVPVVVGVKITANVQVPLAGTDVPLHVSLVSVKSPETTMLLTLSGTVLGLVNVSVIGALATCTG